MVREIDFSTARWIRGSGLPDPNGPTDVAYTPYETDWFARPLIEVVGDTARRVPDQIAIDDGVIRLSYAQLYQMACRLSHAIHRAESAPGPIGIKLTYDALHSVAVLGCLAAGRPCLLMSRDHPPDYSRRLAEAAGVKTLLINAADARDAPAQGGPLRISIEPVLMTGEGFAEQPAGRLDIDEPAFILSTSGSTGVPKLVARSQRRMQQSVSANIDAQHLNGKDRFLILGAATNGAAIRGLGYLMIAATVHLVDVQRTGLGGILRVVRDQKITILGTTVSLLKALVQLDEARAHLESLRVVSIGGEMLLHTDLTQIRAALPPACRLMYSLAMTETAVAKWFVPEKDDHDPVRVAVGYLQPETEVLLLDDEGRPCAPGEIGELIVRSRRVALGEWVDGQVMPDRFPRDPDDPTKRIYRTGDLARFCPDGVMVVHGRKDRMIKIRGQRVEPAVVETAIRNVPGVADAVVAAKQSGSDIRIYGFVVPKPRAGAGLLAEVQSALKTALPSYMRPSDVLIVDSLPTNAAGKVDVKSLLEMITSPDGLTAHAVESAPSGELRGMVADAWRVAFGAARKESRLGFDAAGGDSLQFMQIVFRLEQLSGTSLPLSVFDVSMTQEDMARSLEDFLKGGGEPRWNGKPIFMLPGVGGDEPRLLQFRIGCSPEVSIVNLDYGDWTQWVAPGFGFETIVDRLVARIQALAPTGPLTLAGYSLGGQAAFVIAAKLHAVGREIENLLLLDSDPIVQARGPAGAEAPPLTLRQEYLEWRTAHRRGEGAFALALIATRRLVSPRWAPLLRWLARHRRAVLPGRIDFYLSFHLHRSWLMQLAADWRRRLPSIPKLPLPVTLFRSSAGPDRADRIAAWTQYSPMVTVVPVGGDHFTMLDPPHLADLCARFKAACGVEKVREFVPS